MFVYLNHPDEETGFSIDDIVATEAIIAKLAENDIGFYDHYVVSGTVVHSMRHENLLNRSEWNKAL